MNEWKHIAGISGNDRISGIHIYNFLLSHDIKSSIEGSVVYSIAVPPTKVEQASQLLYTDAKTLGYKVWFENKNCEVVNADTRREIITRSTVSSALEKPEFGSETALGRFLRSDNISRHTSKYPCIISLSVYERRYLATPKTHKTGYDVEIKLQKSLQDGDDKYRGWYQVYDDGNQVAFLGGSESINGKQ